MRVKEIDIARGFTVLIMPAVHVLMINSSITTQTSLLGKIFGFLAEGPGAQLFMLLMGISFAFSRKKSLPHTLEKAVILFLAGYSLNFLKFDIPMLTGIMPESFLNDYQIPNNSGGLMKLFLLGDILHFAAIAFVILGIIYFLPKYHLWCILFAGVIISVSPIQINHLPPNLFLKHLLNLLFAYDEYVYFPVFPWLCYPLVGLCLGHYLLLNHKNFFGVCRNIGIVLLIGGKLLCFYGLTVSCDNFYKTGIGGTLYHLGVVMLWLYFSHLVVTYFPTNHFFNLLQWLSRNITSIYLIQWVCIFWFINVGGYQELNVFSSLIYILFMTVLTFGLSYLWHVLYQKA